MKAGTAGASCVLAAPLSSKAQHAKVSHTCLTLCVSVCFDPTRRYFDPETVGLDFKGMTADLEAAPEGSVVVLHGERGMGWGRGQRGVVGRRGAWWCCMLRGGRRDRGGAAAAPKHTNKTHCARTVLFQCMGRQTHAPPVHCACSVTSCPHDVHPSGCDTTPAVCCMQAAPTTPRVLTPRRSSGRPSRSCASARS